MAKKILIVNGSPKKNGNTAALVEWFAEGARSSGAQVEIAGAAFLTCKVSGCTSCRQCQTIEEYRCVIDDGATAVLGKMAGADAIVMASPLYFFAASAQLKVIVDRMFSLYKWDNEKGTMKTPLAGKQFVFLGSAYEDVGLDAMEAPFVLTARYTGMPYESLLVPNAGVSGDIGKQQGVHDRAVALGAKIGKG